MYDEDAIEKAIRNSAASIEMEGFHIDEECKEWCREYMRGKITMEEYIERLKKQVAIDT